MEEWKGSNDGEDGERGKVERWGCLERFAPTPLQILQESILYQSSSMEPMR